MTTEFETDMYDLNIESDAMTGTYSATKYNRYILICEPIICIEPQQKGWWLHDNPTQKSRYM